MRPFANCFFRNFKNFWQIFGKREFHLPKESQMALLCRDAGSVDRPLFGCMLWSGSMCSGSGLPPPYPLPSSGHAREWSEYLLDFTEFGIPGFREEIKPTGAYIFWHRWKNRISAWHFSAIWLYWKTVEQSWIAQWKGGVWHAAGKERFGGKKSSTEFR